MADQTESETNTESIEASASRYFTRWTILASGEGAGRISSLYLTKMQNEAIGERVLLMNTNRADINNTLIEMEKTAKNAEERSRVLMLRQKNVVLFGEGGAGNVFKEGELSAERDFESKLRRPIEALGTAAGDVILDIATMGGGTGNGSIPFIIDKIKHGESVSLMRHVHVAMGILPYEEEAPHRHFNAICGITRLLKYGEDQQQNADMVIFIDNSKIRDDLRTNEGIDAKFPDINRRIIQAIDLLIAPGRQAKGVIDIKDYVKFPSMMNMYHFTPCLSTGNDVNFIGLDVALDDAVENSFVHMDPSTAVIAYCIVRVPEKYLGTGDFIEDKVYRIFNEWKKDNIIGKMGMVSLTYEKNSKKDTFDVMLLLGGFNFREMIEKSWKEYKDFQDILKMSAKDGNVTVEDVILSADELDLIEDTLKKYMKHTDEVIEKFTEES